MIASIYKLLTSEEKIYLYFVLILLCLNSLFELISLVVFYPLLKILIDNSYDISFLHNYLNKINIDVSNQKELIFFFLAIILFVFFIKNTFFIYFVYQQNKFVKKIRIRIADELTKKYIFLSYPSFFKKTLGNIMRNIDLSINFSHIVFSLILFYSEILVFLLLIGFLLNIEFKLTFLIISILILLVFILKRFSKNKFYRLGIISQKYAERLNKVILQTFSGIREIKILNKEDFFSKKFFKINNLEASNNFIRDILLQLPKVIIEFIVVFLLVSIIFGMFTFEYQKSEILLYVSLILIAAGRLMPSAIRIMAALQRLKYHQPFNQILINEFNTKNEIKNIKENKISKPIFLFKKNIIFSNVDFFYEKNKIILKKINLNIKKNSCIGIVGSSGSGKSTFTDLIIGLLKSTSGSIKVDNKSINFNTREWQNKISYVSQLPFFLNETIEKNIAFGVEKKDIDKKLIIEVSKKSQIYNDIKNMKFKFQTKVGESGINLSGGQLQRIAIARALYRKSELIILDESTNSLDRKNEDLFFDFLKTLKKKLTIIIISHQSNNLVMCDNIYSLENKSLKRLK